MASLVWSESLSVGIKSIDDQHKRLIDLINSLEAAKNANNSGDALVKVVDGLLEYTKTHFTYEEQLFAKHGYAETAAHKSEHENFVKRALDARESVRKGGALVAGSLVGFLNLWLISHIKGTDKKYSEFLISKGVR